MGFNRNTPWGQADTYSNVGQGIFVCSTPSHGGYYVPDCMLHNIPAEQRQWAKRWSGSENWYEEDCCWAAVCVAFPDRFPADALAVAKRVLQSCIEER